MSRSDIKRQDQWVRPSFNFAGPAGDGGYDPRQCAAQLLESIRNLEEIQLREIAGSLDRIARTLDRIDRRLAKKRPLGGGRA